MGYLTQDRQVLTRLADRLRSMAETALTRPRDDLDGRSVSGAVHRLCAWAAAEMGVQTAVPLLHPLATGDQLEVVGREFLDWAEDGGGEATVERWRAEVDRVRLAA